MEPSAAHDVGLIVDRLRSAFRERDALYALRNAFVNRNRSLHSDAEFGIAIPPYLAEARKLLRFLDGRLAHAAAISAAAVAERLPMVQDTRLR